MKFIQNLRVLMELQIIRHMGRVAKQVIKYVYTQRISTILYQSRLVRSLCDSKKVVYLDIF